MLRYQRDPTRFRTEVMSQPRGRWIVVDEVRRVPKLLDEVHFLLGAVRAARPAAPFASLSHSAM